MIPALVLTAGLATRLRPLSLVRAKAALPVAGQPLVVRILRWLHANGITDVVLNLHHAPETLTRLLGDVEVCWANRVRFVSERAMPLHQRSQSGHQLPLGTAIPLPGHERHV